VDAKMEEIARFSGNEHTGSSCPECSSYLVLDAHHGEYICQSCGYVVLDKLVSSGHETHQNNYMDKIKSVRASGQVSFLLLNYGLQTEIGISTRDYSGKPISYATAERLASVRRLHSRLKASPDERRIVRVLSMIDKICSKMLLPRSLSEAAAKIYRTYSSRYDTRGFSVAGNAIAAVYLACKQCSIARGLEEITGVANTGNNSRDSSSKVAFRCYKKMIMSMTDQGHREQQDTSVIDSIDLFNHVVPIEKYISKIANKAKIDWRVQKYAIDIARQMEGKILLSGKDPMGIAAAYLYIAICICGYNMYLADIAIISEVTEITIRTRCKEILSSFRLQMRVRSSSSP
jgi:transcription initiation factor TFIIB